MQMGGCGLELRDSQTVNLCILPPKKSNLRRRVAVPYFKLFLRLYFQILAIMHTVTRTIRRTLYT